MSGDLMAEVDAYIAALMPSPQAQVLSRVVDAADNACAVMPGGELTDGEQAAATVIADGSAPYVLVCVPVSPDTAAQAAACGARSVRVTVTLDLEAVMAWLPATG